MSSKTSSKMSSKMSSTRSITVSFPSAPYPTTRICLPCIVAPKGLPSFLKTKYYMIYVLYTYYIRIIYIVYTERICLPCIVAPKGLLGRIWAVFGRIWVYRENMLAMYRRA